MFTFFEIFGHLSADGMRLLLTRFLRLFAYGFLSVVLVLYLKQLGFEDKEVGLLLMMTLLGDTAISLWISISADRLGRRRMLILGAFLMFLAGLVFAGSKVFWVLLLAATIGVISPSGYEVGPFLSIEQAALSQIISDKIRTRVFAWYNMLGSVATALGSLMGGFLCQWAEGNGFVGAGIYQPVIVGYASVGFVLALVFWGLSEKTEVPRDLQFKTRFGLGKSRGIVFRLAALFAVDAFGGGFVIQSVLAYWFHVRFGVELATLGGIFFGANILAGLSSLVAAWVAARIGLINTMVFTHLPSNVLLILVPLMPNLTSAVVLLLVRFSISQMDVPTRQSYIMGVVSPEERSAASGVTSVVRSIGASLSPMLAALFIGNSELASIPFFLAGAVKILYDLILYRSFVSLKTSEEE